MFVIELRIIASLEQYTSRLQQALNNIDQVYSKLGTVEFKFKVSSEN